MQAAGLIKLMDNQAAVAPPTPAAIIQADAASFKDLVQKLTGTSGSVNKPRPKPASSRRFPFKLQERRKHPVRNLEIIKLHVASAGDSPGTTTRSDPLPVRSPIMPLGCDSVTRERVRTESPLWEEERAIAEKGFYLHSSTAKAEPPVLLTLFPLTSPKQRF